MRPDPPVRLSLPVHLEGSKISQASRVKVLDYIRVRLDSPKTKGRQTLTGNVDSVKPRAKVKGPPAFEFLIEKSIRSRLHWCKRLPSFMTTMKNIRNLRNKLRAGFCVNLLNDAFWKGQRPNKPTQFWWELTERGKCRHSVLP